MKLTYAIALFIAATLNCNAFAHKAWILPSQTQFSGNNTWVTVDACASNDLFYFNHVPLSLQNLSIVGPTGESLEAANTASGKYRSVFDVELTADGTYRIALLNGGLSASWTENGERKRWRGSAESFANEVPQDAEGLSVSESHGRIETFVTKNAPTLTSLEATGKGIELVPMTHPNDLYAGETARFRLVVDGAPQGGLEVTVIRGETRYRNSIDELKVVSDAAGEISLVFEEPGMYWLSTSTTDDKTSVPQAQSRRLSYTATLEVLPE